MRTFFVIIFAHTSLLWGMPLMPSCEHSLSRLEGEVGGLHEIAVETRLWESLHANSEQMQPYYIGATPRDMVLKNAQAKSPTLSSSLKDLGENQAIALLRRLNESDAEFEVWPTLNDQGDRTWVFARWRKSSSDPWKWMNNHLWLKKENKGKISPILPINYRPSNKEDASLLFDDFLKFNSLYQKPIFGDAIWTTNKGKSVVGAWLPLEDVAKIRERFSNDPDVMARILPQPARFNDKPISFILKAHQNEVKWEDQILWVEEPSSQVIPPSLPVIPLTFSPEFETKFREDIEILSGQKEAVFPKSGREMLFTRKSSAQKKNHLEAIADYLTERYQMLGLEVRRQSFMWRGIKQSNLIVVIPGEDRSLAPLLFADHFDTAFAEDAFDANKKRISNPGADDNGTATASLLRAAEELRGKKPKRDIWLLHLTGEEYPADDLGIRHFMKELMKEKKDIAGMVLIDMIGIRDPKDPVFQVNGGQTQASLELSGIAMQAAGMEATGLEPKYRSRFDQESYLYNTDGYILDNLGYPVVFFNEHLNRKTMGGANQHYHQTSDLPQNIDWGYATKISKSAILTLFNAASR